MSPDDIVVALGLQPHPEGGWFAETYRDASGHDGRAHATAIYFLLKAGERSHWHRVDSAEIWLWHAGGPLALKIGQETVTLGPDLAAGQRPQAVVPPDIWQAAEPLGDWTLVSCVVAPGFEFSGFELAPPSWAPRPRPPIKHFLEKFSGPTAPQGVDGPRWRAYLRAVSSQPGRVLKACSGGPRSLTLRIATRRRGTWPAFVRLQTACS